MKRKPKRLFRGRQSDRQPEVCRHKSGLIVMCKHLYEGTAWEWCAIVDPEFPDAEPDWICADCGTRYPDKIPLDDLVSVCVDCVRRLRERSSALMN